MEKFSEFSKKEFKLTLRKDLVEAFAKNSVLEI